MCVTFARNIPRGAGETATERERVSRMETADIDFNPWGLEADWPSRRWLEPIYGRRGEIVRGVRLGHASTLAMVLTCTYPRIRFGEELTAAGSDPIREIAFETTYTQINLALHQIKVPGARPDGLIGSLVRYASEQADRHAEWPRAQWGTEVASTTKLASWQSGFSLAYRDVYVIVHACGIDIDQVRLMPAGDLSSYLHGADPSEVGAMHWELWANRPELAYDDLTRTLVAP
jgi:hypothetical protein